MVASIYEPMGRFDHGGHTYGRVGAVDFSASLNPLGMPEASLAALRDNVQSFEDYPDVACAQLAEAVAEFERVDAARICLCAGATDAFDRIVDVLAPKHVLLFDPCFSGYERALRRCSASVTHVPLREEEDFDFTERALGEACALLSQDEGPDLVFLCTPNNPTGRAVGEDFLRGLSSYAQYRNVTVVLDACFADIAGLDSAVPLQEKYPNLIVVKAFTKTFAMAGLRVGYAICSDAALAEKLRDAGAQWAVSVPAQIAGVAALQEPAYIMRTLSYVGHERIRLEAALTAAGMRVVPSCANFILFQDTRADAADALNSSHSDETGAPGASLFDALAERGVIVRRCGNFAELNDTWYRIAVRTTEQNTRFIEALKEVVGS